MHVFSRLILDERAATMVEYAILVAFIAAVCITVVMTLGGKTSSEFSQLNSSFGDTQ